MNMEFHVKTVEFFCGECKMITELVHQKNCKKEYSDNPRNSYNAIIHLPSPVSIPSAMIVLSYTQKQTPPSQHAICVIAGLCQKNVSFEYTRTIHRDDFIRSELISFVNIKRRGLYT